MGIRQFSDKPLHILPGLPGAPLASPTRRAAAICIDMVILIIPSVAAAVCAAWLALSSSDPQALAGMRALLQRGRLDEKGRLEALTHVLPLLARIEAPGLPSSARAAIEEGKAVEAAEAVRDYEFQFAMQFGEFEKPPLDAKTIRIDVGELIPKSLRFLALYGVAATYFALFNSWRRGATIGKRIVGIRIARLDGHRLSLLESLERFVGYLHIPGTLGLSLLDLWRDPNRRLPHDRVVHTSVFREQSKTKK